MRESAIEEGLIREGDSNETADNYLEFSMWLSVTHDAELAAPFANAPGRKDAVVDPAHQYMTAATLLSTRNKMPS